MGRSILVISALLLSHFLVQAAAAEVHEVTLQNFSFSPNDITIQVGDTVRFRNVQGFHDVTADDQSFSRPSASAPWTFEQTFNQEGVVLVHCTVHSSPGQSIASFMNARISVQAATGGPTPTPTPGSGGELGNLSTRGFVGTGDQVLIAGLIVIDEPTRVLIRAQGPSLAAFGVSGVLDDPSLELFSGQNPIASNDDWVDATNQSEIEATGLAPNDDREPAILITLEPGAYTAIVRGVDESVGVGIVEVFRLGDD